MFKKPVWDDLSVVTCWIVNDLVYLAHCGHDKTKWTEDGPSRALYKSASQPFTSWADENQKGDSNPQLPVGHKTEESLNETVLHKTEWNVPLQQKANKTLDRDSVLLCFIPVSKLGCI